MRPSIQLPIRKQLTALWEKPDLFSRASQWVTVIGHRDVEWDYSSCSRIDGIMYPGYIIFKSEEVYVVFRLMFQSLLKF